MYSISIPPLHGSLYSLVLRSLYLGCLRQPRGRRVAEPGAPPRGRPVRVAALSPPPPAPAAAAAATPPAAPGMVGRSAQAPSHVVSHKSSIALVLLVLRII